MFRKGEIAVGYWRGACAPVVYSRGNGGEAGRKPVRPRECRASAKRVGPVTAHTMSQPGELQSPVYSRRDRERRGPVTTRSVVWQVHVLRGDASVGIGNSYNATTPRPIVYVMRAQRHTTCRFRLVHAKTNEMLCSRRTRREKMEMPREEWIDVWCLWCWSLAAATGECTAPRSRVYARRSAW